jgi:hypothetical protein
MLEKIVRKLMISTAAVAVAAGVYTGNLPAASAAETHRKDKASAASDVTQTIPAEEYELVKLVKKMGQRGPDGSYHLNFVSGQAFFDIHYKDCGSQKDCTPNRIIDHNDELTIWKRGIEPNPSADERKRYPYVADCSGWPLLDNNLDGYASRHSIFGYKKRLRFGEPLDDSTVLFRKHLNEALSHLKKGTYQIPKNVGITWCD